MNFACVGSSYAIRKAIVQPILKRALVNQGREHGSCFCADGERNDERNGL